MAGTNLAEDFDVYFDNLASAATHGNEIVQGALSTITSTSASQHTEVKKLLMEVKSAMPSSSGGERNNYNGGGRRNNDISSTKKQKTKSQISQLQVVVKKKWIPGNF